MCCRIKLRNGNKEYHVKQVSKQLYPKLPFEGFAKEESRGFWHKRFIEGKFIEIAEFAENVHTLDGEPTGEIAWFKVPEHAYIFFGVYDQRGIKGVRIITEQAPPDVVNRTMHGRVPKLFYKEKGTEKVTA